MTPRFILITTAAILLAGCDRHSAEADAAKTAEIAAQRQIEQAANDKMRQLEERLNAADQQKASDREAELARVKEELAQIKKDKETAQERIHNLQSELSKPAPASIAEAPASRNADDNDGPRNAAIHADLERVVEEDEEREPVYTGRVVPETQRVTNVEAFYEPLDKYGDWVQTDDYGYVFRPEVARRHDWRPYTDGRWVHTNHGWTWESNEDFGWATYHYGRWARVSGAGWVWVPGREWGPGWVSWRRGKEDCGWAPLPPESRSHQSFTASVDRDYDIGPSAYVFIAMSNFGARSYAPVIERPERNVAIINQTVNVTNITYNNVTNNTVVYNGGPSYDVIRARSKQPVENVQVSFAPQPPAGNRAKIANVRQGNTFQVAAAPVALTPNAPPARVAERLGKPKEDKGWDGVNPAQAQQVKQNIIATSNARPNVPRPNAAVNPAVARPANPAVVAPPTRPVLTTPPPVARPSVVSTTPPQITPRPEMPARPPAVERPRPLDPDAARPKPAIEVPPKLDQPEPPKRPVENEPPKMREPEVARPRPTPEPTAPPKVDAPARVRPTNPERPTPDAATARENAIARQQAIDSEKAAAREQAAARQQAIERQKATRQEAIDREASENRQKAAARQEAMEHQKAARQEAINHQVSEDRQQAAARQQAIERQKAARQDAMEKQQTSAREQAAARQQAIERQQAQQAAERRRNVEAPPAQQPQRVVQPQRAPEAVERQRPQPQRQPMPAPVVQRAPQQQAPAQPQSAQPAKRGEDPDKKKKKENEQ